MSYQKVYNYRHGDPPFAASKDPNDIEIYAIALDSELYSGEGISSVTWVVPAGLTKDSEVAPVSFTDQAGNAYGHVRIVVLSGGTAGQIYTITGRFSLSGGVANRQIDVSFKIKCEEH